MFIDFEGIDGSGKTTLSNRIAKRLEAMGHRVLHARENGELKSGLARRVRELTRDARHLDMSPRAEFFLNLTRDAQQLDEVIRPALAGGALVISDRYLYSQLALTGGGRGLSPEALRASCELASQGVWPDLVVLVDVDPELARWRKRLGRAPGAKSLVDTGSRKGLAGAGLNVRVRGHFLAQARRDPERWLVLANEDRSLEELEEEVLTAIVARLSHVAIPPSRRPPLRRAPPPPATARTAGSRFHSEVSKRYVREPSLALALLGGFSDLLAHRLRLHALEAHPAEVALGLRALDDASSWSLREHLAAQHPQEVARSLPQAARSERALALRRTLFESASDAVLEGLIGDASPDAWALRERGLAADLLGPVLIGLAGVRGERAEAVRDQGLGQGLGAHVALSLSGLAEDAADALRERLLLDHPLQVLKSTLGLDTRVATKLRELLFERAPKPVLRSLTGLTTDAAFALRARGAPLTKEAIDSLDGIDHPQAWALREQWLATWPTTVASSLTGLPDDARMCSLLDRLLAADPGRLLLLRNAALAMQIGRGLRPAAPGDPRPHPGPVAREEREGIV